MKHPKRLYILLLLFPLFSVAQVSLNADSLYEQARINAFGNNHQLAHEQCDSILKNYPLYTEVKLLKARIYSWDKNYSEAQSLLEKILAESPDNMDAFKAITDNSLWNNQYEDAILFAEKGLRVNPNQIDLLLNKAKAQMQLKRYKDAEKTLATIAQLDPENSEAKSLAQELTRLKRQNQFALYNLHDRFSKIYTPRNLFSVEYKRITSVGPVLARVNWANRFGTNGLQYEVDFYPRLTKRLSGFLNYGFSADNTLFPKHKFGAELFYTFSKMFTASGGIRYMDFVSNDLLTYTASLNVYTGKYLFNGRVYITPTKQKTGESVFVFARRFFKDEFNYITLTLGQGVSPENSNNALNFDSYFFLKSQTARLQWVKTFYNGFGFQLGTEFTRLQVPFDTQQYLFQFTLDTGIKYQF